MKYKIYHPQMRTRTFKNKKNAELTIEILNLSCGLAEVDEYGYELHYWQYKNGKFDQEIKP